MATLLPAEDRKRLATKFGIDEAYLYQCLTGRRDMNPARAMRLETESSGELRRWSLCKTTWHLIWPDLLGAQDAPDPTPREAANSGPAPFDAETAAQ